MNSKRLDKVPLRVRKEVDAQLRELSELLKARRNQMGLSQEALAELLKISPTMLQFIEQGRRYPSLPMLFYILVSLEIEATFEISRPSRSLLRAADSGHSRGK